MRLASGLPVRPLVRATTSPRLIPWLVYSLEIQRRIISRQARELDAAQNENNRLRALLNRDAA